MHRSGTRREDARNITRGILPPGRMLDGEATPLTETTHKPRKTSTKSRPLSSSTNRDVPGPDDGSRLPSAPSQWKMGRSPTPGSPDENDDWILNQEAPPLPLETEKTRSRTRTSSASGNKGKLKSEKKPRSFLSQDDTAIATHSGAGEQVATRARRNTDAQRHDTKACPGSTTQEKEKASSLRRRISWGRNKKHAEELPPQESSYKRVSRLGLPELEKDLVPSLRDTVHRMTGDQESTNEALQNPTQRKSSSKPYVHSAQTFSSLAPPARYERTSSRPSSPSQNSTSGKTRHRSHSYRSPGCNEDATCDHEPSDSRKLGKYAVEYHKVSPKRSGSRDHAEPKQARSQSLKAPQSGRSQMLSPNRNSDDSASETILQTPRTRSSSRSHVSPLLASSSSPARTPSNIPTPKFRSRSSSSAARGEKSPSLPDILPQKSPRVPESSRSPALVSTLLETGAHSRTTRADNKGRTDIKLSSRSPKVRDENDDDGTPKPSRTDQNRHHQNFTDSDSACDEKIQFVDYRRFNQPAKFSPNRAYGIARETHDSVSRREKYGMHADEENASDCSVSAGIHAGTAIDDSHLRRKNELADLVAGLNLDLGSRRDGHAPTSGYARRNPSRDQSEGPGSQQIVGIAVGGSSESVVVKDKSKPAIGANDSRKKHHDPGTRERQAASSSRRAIILPKRLSSTPQPDACPAKATSEGNKLLRPDSGNVNRDSLLMLSSERQREAFGIPPSVSDIHNGGEILSSVESGTSLKIQALESDREVEASDGLGLSHGAERLFHTLGIGADAQYVDGYASKKERTSWRSSMAEAEKYLSENACLAPGAMSVSSSSSSIYEDDVPERPWQKRERDLDRVQSISRSSVKSSWRKTLSQSAFMSLLERHGEIEMRRQEVIWELCETEQAFLRSLRTALKTFAYPLLGKNRVWVSGLPNNVSRLLDWLEDIFQLHAQISSALQRARSSQYPVVLRIAETLRVFVPRLEVYQPYIVRLDEVIEEIEEIMRDPANELGEFLRLQNSGEDCAGMSFSAFLWLPLTRLGRYLKYFNELWTFTPRCHVDHLATFSLLHSATMVVRVLREVKLREEEYAFVKDLLSRIQGFANLTGLVRRERRLIAHGALQRVHVSERTKDLLEGTSFVDVGSGAERVYRTTVQPARRRRANSLDSCISETASVTSISSAASDLSLNEEDNAQYKLRRNGVVGMDGPNHDRRFGARARANDTHREKTRMTSVYAFVFTDLAIFTTMISHNSIEGNRKQTLELLNDIGICRVVSVADYSGNLGYEHLIGVQVLPMDIEELDKGLLSDASAASLFLHLPSSGSSAPRHSEARQRWSTAFEQCFRFTLRSISFPAHSGKYLALGRDSGQDENTRQTVMSILASGLPLPKSPSVQIGELEKSAAQDASLREREERGWWALRFQQILHEMQRDELPLPLLQKATGLPVESSRRKTVTGRRRLKLVSGRK
ncbi:hypothetical protein ACEPAI_1710 [Sanghuangporus weigelae]